MTDEFREWPRADTLRAKKKMSRRTRNAVRNLNRYMRKDVFGDRFTVVLVEKDIRPYYDNSGWNGAFCVEFRDAEAPERNHREWYSYHGIVDNGMFCGGKFLDKDLNDFIVQSDFWTKYAQKEELKKL